MNTSGFKNWPRTHLPTHNTVHRGPADLKMSSFTPVVWLVLFLKMIFMNEIHPSLPTTKYCFPRLCLKANFPNWKRLFEQRHHSSTCLLISNLHQIYSLIDYISDIYDIWDMQYYEECKECKIWKYIICIGRMKMFDLTVWKVFNDFGYTCSVAGSGW